MPLAEPRKFSLKSFIKKEYVSIFLIGIVCASFVFHFSHRNEHFQECDSSEVYDLIYKFPQFQLSAISGYSQGNFISKDTARSLINQKFIGALVNKYAKDVNNQEISQERIIEKLTKLNPISFLRLGIVSLLSSSQTPHFIKSLFGLPLSSTYSPGAGLVYGLISGSGNTYAEFMSRAIAVTQILFHLSVILLFFIALKLSLNRYAALLSALFMLFAISFYSYGYHLGSTVWNFSSSFLWLWFSLKYWHHPNRLKRISLISAVLILFNYLIFLYWLAFISFQIHSKIKNNLTFKTFFSQTKEVLKSQWLVLLVLLFTFILFYPPAGMMSHISFRGLADIYYIVLNFFSFYVHSNTLNILQFITGLTLLTFGLAYLIKPKKSSSDLILVFQRISIFFLIWFAIFVCFGYLIFAPSRHILFLAPIVFLSVAILMDSLKLNFKDYFLGGLSVLIVIAGFFCLNIRKNDTADRLNQITLTNEDLKASKVIIEKCLPELAYKKWPEGIATELEDPRLLKKDQTYIFVGQNKFTEKLLEWNSSSYYNTSASVKILGESQVNNPTYFIAHNPDMISASTRPNEADKTRFKVLDLILKK